MLESPDASHGVQNEDDTETLLDTGLMEYMRIVTSSDAYGWLLSSIRCDLEFILLGKVDAKGQISALILNGWKPGRTSRVTSLPVFAVTYLVTWDVLEFIKAQEFTVEPTEALWSALTLIGTLENAEGVACGDYMCRTWPSTGAKFMDLMENHINSDKSVCRKGGQNWEQGILRRIIRD